MVGKNNYYSIIYAIRGARMACYSGKQQRIFYCRMIKHLFPLLFFALSCTPGLKRYDDHFIAMDTVLSIALYVHDDREGEEALSTLKAEAARLEKTFSAFIPGSEIRKINERPDRLKTVTTPEVADLVRLSLKYSEETQGAFDITIAPVKWLWGFGTGLVPHKPPEDSIRAAKSHVNYRNLSVRGDTLLFKDPGMEIDLGGIAKGYALARLQKMVRDRGIVSYMIDAGGDVVLGDQKPGREDWVIGIRHPRRKEELIRKAGLSNAAIASSGDYERFFMQDSVRYHHIFDPKTGYPTHGIISATVVSSDPVRAVVYSKIFILRGKMDITALPEGIRQCVLVNDRLDVMSYPVLQSQGK
jgi:thiamine biosynthesis lipoprotein